MYINSFPTSSINRVDGALVDFIECHAVIHKKYKFIKLYVNNVILLIPIMPTCNTRFKFVISNLFIFLYPNLWGDQMKYFLWENEKGEQPRTFFIIRFSMNILSIKAKRCLRIINQLRHLEFSYFSQVSFCTLIHMPWKAILLFTLHFCVRKPISTESYDFGMAVGV
jgi:hypothetical protein